MTAKSTSKSGRLGHDPLEWLDDDDEEVSAPEQGHTIEDSAPVDKPVEERHTDTSDVSADGGTVSTVAEIETETETETEGEADAESSSSVLSADGIARVQLPEKLLVQVVEEFHQQVRSLFDGDLPEQLWLNAEDTQDADASGIQLLYVLVHQLSSKGCEVHLVDVQPALTRRFHQAGLNALFTPFIDAA